MLSTLRVLDLSWQLPGPYAAKLLADFNAGLARMRNDGSYRKLLALHQME